MHGFEAQTIVKVNCLCQFCPISQDVHIFLRDVTYFQLNIEQIFMDPYMTLKMIYIHTYSDLNLIFFD